VTRVMIVDDDRTTVSLLQTLLEIDGYDVQTVTRGNDVIPTAEATPPDIILMDYNLNDVDGITVLGQIRAHAGLNHLPVIIASGMNVEDDALAAGATSFLGKPYDPEGLPGLINRWAAT
jgi:CheY-like chemotaxis protein